AAAQTPATFRVAGEVAIERLPKRRLATATAVRIPTGGTLPPGADAVVPVEAASLQGDFVTVGTAAAGENVIPGGSDMRRGDVAVGAGTRLSARHLGVLATLGIALVCVYRRPVVAVLSSGDELLAIDAPANGARVRDSNRYVMAASLRAMGAAVRHYPTVGDDAGACEAALRSALRDCDAI